MERNNNNIKYNKRNFYVNDNNRKDPNDDRPIRSNNKGKYNLDFIDWNNEHERVCEVMQKIDNGEFIEDKDEERRIKKYMNKENEKNGIKEDIKLNFETVINPDIKKECYICLKNFSRKRKVKKINCGHMFCEDCLLPWIKYNHKCPICKYEFPSKLKEEPEEIIQNINNINNNDDDYDYNNFEI